MTTTSKQFSGLVNNRAQILCGNCVHIVICSKCSVKNVRYDTDRCQWVKDHYQQALST